MTLQKILLFLRVVEIVSNDERHKNGLKRLGRGFRESLRLNPYNPLSYIAFILMIVVGLFMYGFVGVFEKIAVNNPFKWN